LGIRKAYARQIDKTKIILTKKVYAAATNGNPNFNASSLWLLISAMFSGAGRKI